MPQSFRCDSCAAPLEFAGGKSRFQRCEFCGNQMLVPAEVLDAFDSHQDLGGDLLGQARKIKEIKQLAVSGNKIEAIKIYRETFGCSLKEAKDAVDSLAAGKPVVFTSFQTVDATSYAGSSLDEQKLAEAERLILNGNKIAGIKLLRESFGMGLKEAKDIADRIADGKPVRLEELRHKRNQIYVNSEAVGRAAKTVGKSFLIFFIGIFVLIFVVTIGIIYFVNRAMENRVESTPLMPLSPKPEKNPEKPKYAEEVFKFGGEGLGAGQFDDNRGIAVDGDGRIYSANYSGGRVQVFDSGGKFLTQWSAGEDVYISALAADRSGKVFIPASRGIMIFEGASGRELETIKLDYAESVAVALDGTLWVATRRNEILHLSNDGKQTLGTIKNATQLAGVKTPYLDLIAVDGANNVYVSERDSYFILKFNSKGEFLHRFGGKKDKFTKETPPGRFDSPPGYGLAVDGKGRVYVSQVSDVSVFDGEGGFLDKFKTTQAFGMAFTDKNELWIASRPFVKKYQINEK